MIVLKASRKRSIEKLTQEVLAMAGQENSRPVDLNSLASNMSILLVSTKLNDISGMSFIENDQKYVVINSEEKHHGRARFTIAHEIGHLYLHHNEKVTVSNDAGILLRDINSSTGLDIKEVEANYFAACLLMSADAIKAELTRIGSSYLTEVRVQELADAFEVSTTAMTIRLTSLGFF